MSRHSHFSRVKTVLRRVEVVAVAQQYVDDCLVEAVALCELGCVLEAFVALSFGVVRRDARWSQCTHEQPLEHGLEVVFRVHVEHGGRSVLDSVPVACAVRGEVLECLPVRYWSVVVQSLRQQQETVLPQCWLRDDVKLVASNPNRAVHPKHARVPAQGVLHI